MSNPLGPAFTQRRWYVSPVSRVPAFHNAAGTYTSNTRPSIPAMPLVRAPVVRALESYRDSAAPSAFSDAWTQESSRIHSHLPEPRPCALGSSRIHSHLHEARKASIALLGHRGYTRISTRLAMLSHRSIPGAVTRDHRSHSGSYCVCGTWDFAHPGARRLTLESHPATKRGGRKLNGQSKVLPCVFTGSVVSDTPQRLWPGAQMDCRCTGNKGTASGVQQQRGANRATKEGKASGRSDRHCHLPSTPEGARGRLRSSRCPGRRT